jgi:hypothetical protein
VSRNDAEHWRDFHGTQQSFGRDLRTAVPGLRATQPRNINRQRYRAYDGIGLASNSLSKGEPTMTDPTDYDALGAADIKAEAALKVVQDRNASVEAIRSAIRDLRDAEQTIEAESRKVPGSPLPAEHRAIRYQEAADEAEERIGDFAPVT